jgi:hypothetical protein
LNWCFSGCTSLKGEIIFNTNYITRSYDSTHGTCTGCFGGVDMQNITLSGEASKDVLNIIGGTGKNWTPIE